MSCGDDIMFCQQDAGRVAIASQSHRLRKIQRIGIVITSGLDRRSNGLVVFVGAMFRIRGMLVQMTCNVVVAVGCCVMIVSAKMNMGPRRMTFRRCNLRSEMRVREGQTLVGQQQRNEQ